MYLSVATTHRPATDLGYLLHKNPVRVHEAELAFGRAVMFYPEATEERCEFALALDIDPVGLVRGAGGGGGLLDQYVNDRPYAASSFLSVALARGAREALAGRSRERPELAERAIPLELNVAPVPVRGAPDLVERLFAPLGYELAVERFPLDPERPEWGESPYAAMRLSAVLPLWEALSHVYVLLPVLDNRKHYYVSQDELEKLLAHGEGWLADHPERELIVSRYLVRRSSLIREALARLSDDAGADPETADDPAAANAAEEAVERPLRLHELRLDRVGKIIVESGARRVLDLGCGSGKLMTRLAKRPEITEFVGVETSSVELERAERRREKLPRRAADKVKLLHGSLMYRDARLRGYDMAALVEVIEHMEPCRLLLLERSVFGDAAPRGVIVTTPNREYNALFPSLGAGRFRHPDHRFEWTRAEFRAWAERVAAGYGYGVRFEPVGEEHPGHGAPAQMAVFSR
jgi:3' terminal RNA ribose 2'-O-methyltransferase Hen1